MAQSQSILSSIKKVLNLAESDTSFDVDILMHINSVFSILNQLGIGPAEGFVVEGTEETWDIFDGLRPRYKHLIKTYIYLRVRLLFDPPGTSYALDSMQEQIKEMEWRLNVMREEESWIDPTVPAA